MLVALKLSKAGYYGGDIQGVLDARVDHVFSAFDYEVFLHDYEIAEYELNK